MDKVLFSVNESHSRGRLYKEYRHDFRSPFQRDRDRIVHSTAFRRLAQKTQVFVSHEGDLFRSRLTHSLEVAQVARALARRFRVSEDLAEAVSLAHDLGHPPFGHTGEDALADLMKDFGGFDHNAQALRIVSLLEERYADFRGLNLSWETIEGMAKHNGPVVEPLPWAMEEIAQSWDLELNSYAPLEAQIAAIADDIAYNHHDIQDGVRSGLLNDQILTDIPLLRQYYHEVERDYAKSSQKIKRYEALSRFFSAMVHDVYENTRRELSYEPKSPNDIRHHHRQIVSFSPEFDREIKMLRRFLFENLYRHPKVMETRRIADEILRGSFYAAIDNPDLLPVDWREHCDLDDPTTRARLVSDYISGMTDNYISKEWYFAHQCKWPS